MKWRREIHLRTHRKAKDKEDSVHGVGSAARGSPEGESEAGQIIQISIIHGVTHSNVSLPTSRLDYSTLIHVLGISKQASQPVRAHAYSKFLSNIEKIMILFQTESINLKGFYSSTTEI